MNARTKSTLLLLATLLIGMLLGALVHARMVDHRIERLAMLRSQRGFARFIEQTVEPRDAEQREAVRQILDGAAVRMGRHMADSRREMAGILDSTRQELREVLTEEQLARLDRRLERHRGRMMRGGPPGGPGMHRRGGRP